MVSSKPMSEKFTNLLYSFRSPCASHERVRNANQVPTSIRVRRDGGGPGRLIRERASGNRISVVFTVGGPLVYQAQRVRVRLTSKRDISAKFVAGHKVEPNAAVYVTANSVPELSPKAAADKSYNIRPTMISRARLLRNCRTSSPSRTLPSSPTSFMVSRDTCAHSPGRRFVMSQPEEINVNEILFRPTRQES